MRLLDIFPANVHITPNDAYPSTELYNIHPLGGITISGSRLVPATRVIADETYIQIAADSSTGPVSIFKEKYIKMEVDEHKITRFVTVTNKIIAVKKDKSCGCGSRLKNWTPVGSILSAN